MGYGKNEALKTQDKANTLVDALHDDSRNCTNTLCQYARINSNNLRDFNNGWLYKAGFRLTQTDISRRIGESKIRCHYRCDHSSYSTVVKWI
jgi:hypothetical protein